MVIEVDREVEDLVILAEEVEATILEEDSVAVEDVSYLLIWPQ